MDEVEGPMVKTEGVMDKLEGPMIEMEGDRI